MALLPAENNVRIRGTISPQSSAVQRLERSLIECKDCGLDTSTSGRFLMEGRRVERGSTSYPIHLSEKDYGSSSKLPIELSDEDEATATEVQPTYLSAHAHTESMRQSKLCGERYYTN